MSTLVDALGWSLLHSVWQGAAWWLALEALLAWPGMRSPRIRGRLAGGALAAFVVGVAVTFGVVHERGERDGRAVRVASPVLKVDSAETVPNEMSASAVADGRSAVTLAAGGGAAGAEADNGSAITVPWAERLQPALPWLVGLWGLGFVAGLVRHGRQWMALRELWRVPLAELSAEWRERFAALCARCAPRLKVPCIGETAWVHVPQVIGGWTPVILLPAGFLAGVPVAQAEAVLAHELAHLVRRDFWLNVLQSVAEAVFFFHPAVYAFNAHIRRERERACDDLAVEWTGDSLGYARALASLAGAFPAKASADAAECVLAADGHAPGERRSRSGRLLGVPEKRRVNVVPGGWLLVGAIAAYAALFAMSPVIVAQVLSPEERVELVKEAVAETRSSNGPTVDVPMYPAGRIKIVSELRTADGSPVPSPLWGMYSSRNGAHGAGGSFGWIAGQATQSVSAGVVSLLALPEEGWAPMAVVDVAPAIGAAELMVPPMILRKGRALRVKLTEPNGQALAGVKVEVRVWPRKNDRLNAYYRRPWVSDEAGRIVLSNADPEFVYELTAELPGRQNTRRVIERFTSAETVSWVMPASQAIRGQVVDQTTGAPLAGPGVWLAGVHGVEGLYAQNLDEPPLARTDADGRFELPGWNDGGLYALRFTHPTHANTVVGARPGETLRVEMEPGGHRVSGRLKVLTERARGFMREPRFSVVSWISTGSGAYAPASRRPW